LISQVLARTLLVAWVLATPFATGALIARSPAIRRAYARVYPLAFAAGWAGVALLAAGGLLLDGPASILALGLGGPLTGLSFWSRRDDDGGGGDWPEGDDPSPPGDDLDWDSFERDFRDYAGRAGRERVPAA
jgi:hypothetical protein